MDNIIIYQEVLHSTRIKRSGMGFMTIKIDLEKAYDRLSWSFIINTLKEIALLESWVNNIMHCVATPPHDCVVEWKTVRVVLAFSGYSTRGFHLS